MKQIVLRKIVCTIEIGFSSSVIRANASSFLLLWHNYLRLTWYGREVDDGRDHGTEPDKNPKSEEHDIRDRRENVEKQASVGLIGVVAVDALASLEQVHCQGERVDSRLKERSWSTYNVLILCHAVCKISNDGGTFVMIISIHVGVGRNHRDICQSWERWWPL